MSRDFAGVLTGKATNFVGGLPLSFLERPHDVRVDLLPYGNSSGTIGCSQLRESGASPQRTALPQRCPPASAAHNSAATTMSAGGRCARQTLATGHHEVGRAVRPQTALPQRCAQASAAADRAATTPFAGPSRAGQ